MGQRYHYSNEIDHIDYDSSISFKNGKVGRLIIIVHYEPMVFLIPI